MHFHAKTAQINHFQPKLTKTVQIDQKKQKSNKKQKQFFSSITLQIMLIHTHLIETDTIYQNQSKHTRIKPFQ